MTPKNVSTFISSAALFIFLTHTSPKFVFCWYYFSSKYNVVLSVYTLLLTICIISVLTNSAPNGLPITLHYECDTDYNESNSKLVSCRHYDGSGTHTWAKTFTIKWLFMFFYLITRQDSLIPKCDTWGTHRGGRTSRLSHLSTFSSHLTDIIGENLLLSLFNFTFKPKILQSFIFSQLST